MKIVYSFWINILMYWQVFYFYLWGRLEEVNEETVINED